MSVKLVPIIFIDSPESFDKIETGVTSYRQLPEFVKPVYKKWNKLYNPSGDFENIVWVTKKYKKIKQDIVNSKLKETSKRIYLESLCKILMSIDKYKYKKFIKDTYITTKLISLKEAEKMANQPTTPNELKSTLPFHDLMATADALYVNYMELNYVDNYENRIAMLKALIICLNIYQPPMRLDLLNLQFSNDNPIDTSSNYYNISEDVFIINNSKGKADKQFIFDLPDNVFMFGSKIKNLIHKSYSDLPRNYLLFDPLDVDNVIIPSRYYKVILDSTGKNIKQNLLRKIYINHYHLIHRPFLSPAIKADIAKRQLHSVKTAVSNYEKYELANIMSP